MGLGARRRRAVLAVGLLAMSGAVVASSGRSPVAQAQTVSTTLPRRSTTTESPTTAPPPTTAAPTSTTSHPSTTVKRTTTTLKVVTTAPPVTLAPPTTVAQSTTTTVVLTFSDAGFNPMGLLVTIAGFAVAAGLMVREWMRTRP